MIVKVSSFDLQLRRLQEKDPKSAETFHQVIVCGRKDLVKKNIDFVNEKISEKEND